MQDETNSTTETTAAEHQPADSGAAEPQENTLLGSVGAEEPQAETQPADDGGEEPQTPSEWTIDDLQVPDEWKEDEHLQTFAKEAVASGVSKEAAQKMLDLYRQVRENEWKAFVDTRMQWAAEAKRALGENPDEKLATIGRALSELDPKVEKDFREIMNATGVGDHPAVVQVMYELAKRAVGGGPYVQGARQPAQQKKSIREIFYPHMVNEES